MQYHRVQTTYSAENLECVRTGRLPRYTADGMLPMHGSSFCKCTEFSRVRSYQFEEDEVPWVWSFGDAMMVTGLTPGGVRVMSICVGITVSGGRRYGVLCVANVTASCQPTGYCSLFEGADARVVSVSMLRTCSLTSATCENPITPCPPDVATVHVASLA